MYKTDYVEQRAQSWNCTSEVLFLSFPAILCTNGDTVHNNVLHNECTLTYILEEQNNIFSSIYCSV